MDDKDVEMTAYGSKELHAESTNEEAPGSNRDEQEMAYYGKKQQLKVRYTWLELEPSSFLRELATWLFV